MNKSLSTRLMYSFMALIVVIVVGVTAGISYLIADYFFKIKEQELAQKGNEMAETIEYFMRPPKLGIPIVTIDIKTIQCINQIIFF